MINKLIKKIGFICLGLASLALAGCFHVPDEDWIPSKNKVETGNVEKEDEIDVALDSFAEGINMLSSERNELNEDSDINVETGGEYDNEIENESIDIEEIVENENTNDEIRDQGIEENVISEE